MAGGNPTCAAWPERRPTCVLTSAKSGRMSVPFFSCVSDRPRAVFWVPSEGGGPRPAGLHHRLSSAARPSASDSTALYSQPGRTLLATVPIVCPEPAPGFTNQKHLGTRSHWAKRGCTPRDLMCPVGAGQLGTEALQQVILAQNTNPLGDTIVMSILISVSTRSL